MALAQVQKIQLLVSSDIKSELLSSLQEEGLVQIESIDHEKLGLAAPSPEVSELDHALFGLNHCIDFLSRWDKRGFGEKLFGEKPQISRKKKEEILNFEYKTVLEEINQFEEKEKELDSQIRFLQKELEFLLPLEALDLPVRDVKATDSTKILIGFLPFSQFEEFQQRSEEEAIWCKIIHKAKRQAYITVIYHASHEDLVLQILREVSFNPVYFTGSIIDEADDGDRVKDVEEKILRRLEEKQETLTNIDKEGQRLFAHREKLMCVYDVLQNERGKLLTSNLLGETEQVFYLEGWIRSVDIKELQKKLSVYSDWIEYHFRPPYPDEEPPAILENPKVSRPFELITKLYGLPQRRSMDPTLALAPFFFLFVGLTVSEAGYGLLVTLLSLLYLKFGKPKGGLRQFLQLLSILGISTMILGTLIGGWFGFPVRKLMILDPLQDPLSFLILSLVLGFIQVWFGTLLSMITGIKNKNYLQAIFVQGGWLILLPSLVLYTLTKQSHWGIIALSGAGGIVFFAAPSRNPLARFFGGLYSLYDISRYLADVLSYSRLLALGLATSVIAMVVNTLCQTALGIPWVGWLLAALIFVGGHLFNLGISFLGGFVHSMRLQFVEFFSKFYLSGGKPFQPFELESKYVEFI